MSKRKIKLTRLKLSRRLIIIVLIIIAVAITTIVILLKRHSKTTPSAGKKKRKKKTVVDKSVKKAFLDRHNCYRKGAGLPSMKWSDDLAKWAQAWGDNLCQTGYTGYQKPLRHPNASQEERNKWLHNDEWGQNLASFFGSAATPELAVDGWYCECPNYNPAAGKYTGENIGHYTQLMWKDSTEVGCGISTCSDGSTIYTCNYNPGGNLILNNDPAILYNKNVPKKCGIDCGTDCKEIEQKYQTHYG